MPDAPRSRAVAFPLPRLAVLRAHERSHFWHAPRRRLFLETLTAVRARQAGALLDVGCGTGALVRALSARHFEAYGVDPWVTQIGLPAPQFRTGTVECIPWPDATIATVCALDVLEHVDDAVALAELRRVLCPGGLALLSVPAFHFLWGPRDRGAGHLRRYTPSSLRATLSAAGFVVERLFGFQLLLLPVLAARLALARRRGDHDVREREDNPPRLLNGVLRAINEAEVTLGRLVRPPVGTSLVALARRIDEKAC